MGPLLPCPVCGYPGLDEPPRDPVEGGASYEICPCCGFQFGFDDDDGDYSYEQWRADWLEAGMPWRGVERAPRDWHPREQLRWATPEEPAEGA